MDVVFDDQLSLLKSTISWQVNWPNKQCCLAGSTKTAPRILIFSIALGTDYSFYVKSIATYASKFLRQNNSVFATVGCILSICQKTMTTMTYKVAYQEKFGFKDDLEKNMRHPMD